MESNSRTERLGSMSDDALLQKLQMSAGTYPNDESEAARAEARARGLLCESGDLQFKVVTTGGQDNGLISAAQLKKLYLDGAINKHTLVYVPSRDRWLFLSAVFDVPRWDGVTRAPEVQRSPDSAGNTGQLGSRMSPPAGYTGELRQPDSFGVAPPPPAVSSVRRTGPEAAVYRLPTAGPPPKPKRSLSTAAILGVGVGLVFLLGISALIYLIATRTTAPTAESDNSANTTAETTPSQRATPGASPQSSGTSATAAKMAFIPGGTFLMGRSDISSQDAANLEHYPAHSVSVGPFYIDQTEVTNSEYAEFVRETGHPAPQGWTNNAPPPGTGMLPVTYVSLADAQAFAAWRSSRDDTTYRLPTQEEWEFAARGDSSNLYPWGNRWVSNRANVETGALRPVGSFPSGSTPLGVQDMIGNVWEWTSSRASIYPGNEHVDESSIDRNKYVVRGGSYQSAASGAKAITAAKRSFMSPEEKTGILGFRLVRAGS